MKPNRPTIGVLIRFSNSATTLPAVLAALAKQTLQPDRILGVASNCHDDSRTILTAHQATVIEWTEPYAHSRVLNFGLRHLKTDFVLILSSHTVLESPETLERMVDCLSDETIACVSAKWDADPYYSDRIDWQELQQKGLRLGSIYSNSMGLIRRSLWESLPFDEKIPTAEDYAWSVGQLARGHCCARIHAVFSYQRSGISRDEAFARVVFRMGYQHQLSVRWLGAKASLRQLLTTSPRKVDPAVGARLKGWLTSRFVRRSIA